MKIERTVPIEAIINLAIQELSDKYRLDYNTVFAILRDYDNIVAPHLLYQYGAEMLFGVN